KLCHLRRGSAAGPQEVQCKSGRGGIDKKAGNEIAHVRALAGAMHLRMTGENLFGERGAGARHADDEDGRFTASPFQSLENGLVEVLLERREDLLLDGWVV